MIVPSEKNSPAMQRILALLAANENMNGLIREFFPKKMAFESIATKGIEFATRRFTHHPRKCLGYRTPHEVFMNLQHSRHNAVALRS